MQISSPRATYRGNDGNGAEECADVRTPYPKRGLIWKLLLREAMMIPAVSEAYVVESVQSHLVLGAEGGTYEYAPH